MGLRYEEALRLGEPPEPKSKRHELLVGLRAEPDPDGQAASISLAFTNVTPFRVHLPLMQAASIMNEIRHVASQMMERQHLTLDRGAYQLLELLQESQHPSRYEILIDPITHDRLFLFGFNNDAPVTLRLSPDECPIMLAKLARAVARAAN